jgi:Holliday junction resolvase RusA-like endonuclease
MITIDVIGTPAPKGSSRAIMRGGHAVNVPGGSDVGRDKMRNWSNAVAHAASVAMGGAGLLIGQPLEVAITFRVVRPQGHYGRLGLKPGAPKYPSVKPDLDKLVRCTLDPLEGVVFDGDSRIVVLRAAKVYAPNPGATIHVSEVP